MIVRRTAAVLLVLAIAFARAASLWRVRRLSAFTWFAGALALWLLWALCRVIEDSS
jgi:hypothetical protein